MATTTTRIKDIPTTATTAAPDDYFVIDGATNGTRKYAHNSDAAAHWLDRAMASRQLAMPRSVAAVGVTVSTDSSGTYASTNGLHEKGFGGTADSLVTIYGNPQPHRLYAGSGWLQSSHLSVASGVPYPETCQIATVTNAAKLVLDLAGSPDNSRPYVVVEVDGGLAFAGQLQNTGAPNALIIEFTGSAFRTVTITTNNAAFKSVYHTPNATLLPPFRPVVGFIGDSITHGNGLDFPKSIAHGIGWCIDSKVIDFSCPGVGYLSDYGTVGRAIYRLPGIAATPIRCDAFVVALGQNDYTETAENIGTAAAAFLSALKAQEPQALIYVLAPWTTPTVTLTDAQHAAIQSAAQSVGATYIETKTGTGWLRQDTTLYQDGRHPTQAGADLLAYLSASKIRGS